MEYNAVFKIKSGRWRGCKRGRMGARATSIARKL